MKLLLYCTKAKPYLLRNVKGQWLIDNIHKIASKNGKIIAECDFEVEKITCRRIGGEWESYGEYTNFIELSKKSMLTQQELCDYLSRNAGGYAIHIKNLHIFDKPKELNDFYKFVGIDKDTNNYKSIEKAPQNMMYAYEYISEISFSATWTRMLNGCIIISIRPKWLVKILNGEKTIEVRKKVLKEML